MRTPRLFTISLAVCALLSIAACSQPGGTKQGFARLNVIAWDDTDVSLEALGYSISGETDHKSIEIGGGVSSWDADGNKASTLELLVADSEFYDLDALEISGGGRFFFAGNETIRPYGSAHGVFSILDEDLGTQLGLRAGIGTEFAFSPMVFLDLNLNYLLPIIAAEDDVFGTVETEIDGLSLRVGLGIDF